MKIRTQLTAGGHNLNHNEAMKVRSALKAAGSLNHNESLKVRSTLKSGYAPNHNDSLRVRTAVKAGARGYDSNHNQAVKIQNVRRQLKTTSRKTDRIQLMVVRAGLRAGAITRSIRGRK